ncbi:unnamed protein product [Moneuplotes crassus]|uniref:Glycoside hydrolase family 38 central domain-containing protein n=1 Tax=Euplotes crassus TaxID=5936 RepID=A0AAD1XRA5_EUPCR|nr:unnamed protein product [Moneuplotes crassus]
MSKSTFTTILLLLFLSFISGKRLNIHIILHSHNDAGWQNTFEGYYQEKTSFILDNVYEELMTHPHKIFHWADIAFFERWWRDQDDQVRYDVKQLVFEDRLVFMNGGWVMNDEAVTSYKEMVVNMRTGLEFLWEIFGVRPRIGWQIDAFGASASMVSVLHKLGFENLVHNRLNPDFKTQMRSGDGYNFYWQGHQVDPNPEDSKIFCSILENFYILPDMRMTMEEKFLNANMTEYSPYLFSNLIQRSIDSIDRMSNFTAEEYHVMIPFGDDFGFVNGRKDFAKLDELYDALKVYSDSIGYETHIKYDSLENYLQDIKQLDLDYGLYKGDFLPFYESTPSWDWNDFWTGFYSTRIHLKSYERHVFRKLQSIKTLFAIKAAEEGSIPDDIQPLITEAQRKWAILSHHDAITGTHSYNSEEDYYKILDDSLNLLTLAYARISQLGETISPEQLSIMEGFIEALQPENSMLNIFTVVNPTAYAREEVYNFTVPKDQGPFTIINLDGEDQDSINPDSYVVDLEEISTYSHIMSKSRKVFLKVKIPAFGSLNLYKVNCGLSQAECESLGVNMASYVNYEPISSEYEMENDYIQLRFDSSGDLKEYYDKDNGLTQEIDEEIFYFRTDGYTRSGIYLYNPREERSYFKVIWKQMRIYEIPGLKTIYQVSGRDTETKILRTFSLNHNGHEQSQRQFFHQIDAFTDDYIEINYRISFKPFGENSEFRSYIDDSMKLIERPIFDINSPLKRETASELLGFYTFPSVNGGMLEETIEGSGQQVFISWANSNSLGATLSGPKEVSFVIFRNLYNNDQKGVPEDLVESRSSNLPMIFRIDVEDAALNRNFANFAINEALVTFELEWSTQEIAFLPKSSTLFGDLFYHYGTDGNYYETYPTTVDVIEIQPIEEQGQIVLKLLARNRFDTIILIDQNSLGHFDQISKFETIDHEGTPDESQTGYKHDANRIVLSDIRYDLNTFDFAVPDITVPDQHSQVRLDPFEMSEFVIKKSS